MGHATNTFIIDKLRNECAKAQERNRETDKKKEKVYCNIVLSLSVAMDKITCCIMHICHFAPHPPTFLHAIAKH